jgi:spore coat protein U-like protein
MLFKILTTLLIIFPLLTQACSLTVNSAVNFGTYDPLSTYPDNSVGQVQVNCPEEDPPAFTLTLGEGSSGTYTQRTMMSGSYNLGYNLYLNPSYTTVWGDGTSGTGLISDSGSNCAEGCAYTVYGLAPARQSSVGIGSYSDTIVVTLIY